MFHKMIWFPILILLLAIAACAPAATDPDPLPEDDGAEQVGVEAIPAARQALADFLSVDPDSLVLEKIEDAEWSDSCLGLGGPAESCAAVITPGWQVILESNGRPYEVRTDFDGVQVRVADESAGEPAGELPGPDLNGALIFYERSGGLDGRLFTVRIYRNGTIERALGEPSPDMPVETMTVEPTVVETLMGELREAGYFGLERTYLPKDPCCDRFLYLISIQGEAGVHTVEALAATEGTPDALWQSIELIETAINEAFSG